KLGKSEEKRVMKYFTNSAEANGIISSPGRICLFGEHQDYLGLPVIPMAINRRLFLHYQRAPQESTIQISSDALSLTEKITHKALDKLSGTPYDHIKAVFKFYSKSIHGKILPSELKIRSNIPIKSGLSSSAALIVSTVFLVANIILQKELSSIQIADVAYQVEHDILRISCGRMDQSSAALGGIFHMTTTGKLIITPLNLPEYSYFVIGDSEIPRHADIPLKRVQEKISYVLEKLGNANLLSLQKTDSAVTRLKKQEKKLLHGILSVRNNAKQALNELTSPKADLSTIGSLLDEQHWFLRDNYQISHPKIDKMCEIAKDTGALGAKMTGAGFGGCMFALTDSFATARKIQGKLTQQGKSYIVQLSGGVKKELST
ncbi:MAG: mevalonate kinase family protein, partial [Candidatus Hodarchaeales archaeon]